MDNKKIGEFIKSLRLSENLSQEELAQKIPIGRSAVSKWETGKTIPDSGTLLILSTIFNVSTNELLLGEKITNNNSGDINLELYDDRNKFKKRFYFIIKVFSAMLFIFLLYFFITFYNSVKVYDIVTDSDKIDIDGLIVKTKDKIDLKLNTIFPEDFVSLSLIYKNNNQEKQIITSDDHNLSIKDYLGYEEYFNFKEFDTIINNLFLKISYDEEHYKIYNLNLQLSYKNKDLIPVREKSTTESTNYDENKNPIIDIATYKTKLCKYTNCNKSIKYKGKQYKIRILNDSNSIEIIYNKDNFTIKLKYIFIQSNMFLYNKFENDILKEEYSYNLDMQNCIDKNCNSFNNDYELFKKILKMLEE